jgi:hypothetical protein
MHTFPERRSKHKGQWTPLYLEPVPGSGERLCIGVVALDDTTFVVEPVEGLGRFRCVYGEAAITLAWTAELALKEVTYAMASNGFRSLHSLTASIEGLHIGEFRVGAATTLKDLAQLGLTQVSSLSRSPESSVAEESPGDFASNLERRVKRTVIDARPELTRRFGRSFRRTQQSRPIRYGYVGSKLVANFAALTANRVSRQVNVAKARLWDLEQLQSGVLAESLNLGDEHLSYELLVHQEPEASASRTILQASEELEAEADKFQIRFRALPSPGAIGQFLLARETS